MSTLYGSVRCSMLPGLGIYEREDTPELIAMREQVRATVLLFPYAVEWEAPFHTPDGWDYDWGYVLCTDMVEAERVASEYAQAGVYKTSFIEGTDYDHPHTPQGWCKVTTGPEVLAQFRYGEPMSLEESRFDFLRD